MCVVTPRNNARSTLNGHQTLITSSLVGYKTAYIVRRHATSVHTVRGRFGFPPRIRTRNSHRHRSRMPRCSDLSDRPRTNRTSTWCERTPSCWRYTRVVASMGCEGNIFSIVTPLACTFLHHEQVRMVQRINNHQLPHAGEICVGRHLEKNTHR